MAIDNLDKRIAKAKSLGYTDAQINTYLSSKGIQPPPSDVTEFSKGVAKGGLSTLYSASAFNAGPVGQDMLNHAPELKSKINNIVKPAMEANNPAQQAGKTTEAVSEALVPSGVGAVKTLGEISRLMSTASHLPSLLKGITGADALIPHTLPPTATVEDVAKLADEVMAGRKSPGVLKSATDASAPQVTFMEKLAGISPDIKARIKGKPQQFADYMNVMDARNNSDLVPHPLEYATSFVNKTKDIMEKKLSETGSAIGSFRQKIATYQAPRESFNTVRQSFEGQLSKLNLVIKNGKVEKIPGKIAQTISDSEIKSIQSLHDDLQIASQNPSVENLIDLRTKFDNKINFDKAARETSNSLDPLSRSVRKTIADVAKNIVGKSEAAHLDEYSKFMDSYNELRSFTDRNAGAEFLLKRLYSERGGDARSVMQTILKHTGIDLMDHAMFAKIATELGGNPATQGLFRQEITRAGLDAMSLMKGNATGAINTLLEMGAKKLIDAREIFKNAAK